MAYTLSRGRFDRAREVAEINEVMDRLEGALQGADKALTAAATAFREGAAAAQRSRVLDDNDKADLAAYRSDVLLALDALAARIMEIKATVA